MLIRAPNSSFEFVDFRETAPAAAYETMYNENENASLVGGLARYVVALPVAYKFLRRCINGNSGVPGELRGLEYLHKTYASIKWKRLIEPAIEVARRGFPVTEDLVSKMQNLPFLVNDPTWAIDFAPNGTLLQLGDIMTRKRYADTLEEIANTGPDAFYTGELAAMTIAAVQAANGSMTVQDLRNYTIELRKPVQIEYRGYRITGGSAPSGGAVALSALKTVEGYQDLFKDGTRNLSTHLLDEAFRFAFGEVRSVF